MNNEINPADYPNDADYHEADTQRGHIIHSIQGTSENQGSEGNKGALNKPPKPSLSVRILRVLWRRRKWRRIRQTDHPGANWAEITTICITLGIFHVACIQAYIYWEQARIMHNSLQQNERSIILGMGQLAVAARNAKTSEDTFGEMKSGGIDTHDLAVAAGKQADAAKIAATAAKTANNTTREALTSVQRAFVFFVGSTSATKTIVNNKTTELTLTFPHKNAGVTPTKDAEARVNWKDFSDGLPSHFNFPDEGSVQPRQFDIPPQAFGNGTLAIPIAVMEAAKQGRTRIFVWGWVAYHDIFGKTPGRLSEFCDEIANIKSTPEDITDPSASITWDLSLCPIHNCFDDRCTDYKERTQVPVNTE